MQVEELFYRSSAFAAPGGSVSGSKQPDLFGALLYPLRPDPCGGGQKKSPPESSCLAPPVILLQSADQPGFAADWGPKMICGAEAESTPQAEAEDPAAAAVMAPVGGALPGSAFSVAPPQVVVVPAEAALFRPEAGAAPAAADPGGVELQEAESAFGGLDRRAALSRPAEVNLYGSVVGEEPSSGAHLRGQEQKTDLGDGQKTVFRPVALFMEEPLPPQLKLAERAPAAASLTAADPGEPKRNSLGIGGQEAESAFGGLDRRAALSRPAEVNLYGSVVGEEPSSGAHLRGQEQKTDLGDGQKTVFRPVDLFPEEPLPPQLKLAERAPTAVALQPEPVISPAQPQPAESLPTAPGADNGVALKEQLLEQIQARLLYIREKGGAPAEMRLRLNPPEMGEITIRVFSRQGHLSALIQVEAPVVLEILEGSLPELRQRFQQSNLPLEQLDLSVAGRDAQSRGGFRAGRYFQEEQRLEQIEQRGFSRDVLPRAVSDGRGSGGIEYWA